MLKMLSIPSQWPNDLNGSLVLFRRLLAEKDRFIEPTCCGHVRLVDKMAVGVDGGIDGLMAQHSLNILQGLSVCNEYARIGVSQVVQPDFREPGRF